MTNNEARDIASSLSVLLDSILSPTSQAEDVANDAVSMTKDIAKNHPKIKEWIEEFFTPDPDSPDFEQQWDKHIACIKFLKG